MHRDLEAGQSLVSVDKLRHLLLLLDVPADTLVHLLAAGVAEERHQLELHAARLADGKLKPLTAMVALVIDWLAFPMGLVAGKG